MRYESLMYMVEDAGAADLIAGGRLQPRHQRVGLEIAAGLRILLLEQCVERPTSHSHREPNAAVQQVDSPAAPVQHPSRKMGLTTQVRLTERLQ